MDNFFVYLSNTGVKKVFSQTYTPTYTRKLRQGPILPLSLNEANQHYTVNKKRSRVCVSVNTFNGARTKKELRAINNIVFDIDTNSESREHSSACTTPSECKECKLSSKNKKVLLKHAPELCKIIESFGFKDVKQVVFSGNGIHIYVPVKLVVPCWDDKQAKPHIAKLSPIIDAINSYCKEFIPFADTDEASLRPTQAWKTPGSTALKRKGYNANTSYTLTGFDDADITKEVLEAKIKHNTTAYQSLQGLRTNSKARSKTKSKELPISPEIKFKDGKTFEIKLFKLKEYLLRNKELVHAVQCFVKGENVRGEPIRKNSSEPVRDLTNVIFQLCKEGLSVTTITEFCLELTQRHPDYSSVDSSDIKRYTQWVMSQEHRTHTDTEEMFKSDIYSVKINPLSQVHNLDLVYEHFEPLLSSDGVLLNKQDRYYLYTFTFGPRNARRGILFSTKKVDVGKVPMRVVTDEEFTKLSKKLGARAKSSVVKFFGIDGDLKSLFKLLAKVPALYDYTYVIFSVSADVDKQTREYHLWQLEKKLGGLLDAQFNTLTKHCYTIVPPIEVPEILKMLGGKTVPEYYHDILQAEGRNKWIDYLFIPQILEYDLTELDSPSQVQKYQGHVLTITESGTTKSSTAEIVLGVKLFTRTTNANLKGFSSADETNYGVGHDRTEPLVNDEIQNVDWANYEELLEGTSGLQGTGKEAISVDSYCCYSFMGNPVGSGNKYASEQEHFAKQVTEVMLRMPNRQALGRRLGIILIGHEVGACRKTNTDHLKELPLLGKSLNWFLSANFTELMANNSDVRKYMDSGYHTKYKQFINKQAGELQAEHPEQAEFWRATTRNHTHLKGAAVRYAYLEQAHNVLDGRDVDIPLLLERAKVVEELYREINLYSLGNCIRNKELFTEQTIDLLVNRDWPNVNKRLMVYTCSVHYFEHKSSYEKDGKDGKDGRVSECGNIFLTRKDMLPVYNRVFSCLKLSEGLRPEYKGIKFGLGILTKKLNAEDEAVYVSSGKAAKVVKEYNEFLIRYGLKLELIAHNSKIELSFKVTDSVRLSRVGEKIAKKIPAQGI